MRYLSLIVLALSSVFAGSAGAQTENRSSFRAAKIDCVVSLVATDHEINLQIRLKNDSMQSYYFAPGDLPWMQPSGVNIYVTPDFTVPAGQRWDTGFAAAEHFAGGVATELRPGSELRGVYKLSQYYGELTRFRGKGSIGINWNFKLRLRGRDLSEGKNPATPAEARVIETEPIGGFLVLAEGSN